MQAGHSCYAPYMGNATVTGVVVAALAVGACGKGQAERPRAPLEAAPAATATPPAAAPSKPAACAGAKKTPGRSGISWFHDDYAGARGCARAAGKPLVVDLWAPWCHTCLSMKQTVLRDPGLAPMADRFVWLAIDTDKETNGPVLAKLPVASWPTFYVISPDAEAVESRFVGAASVKQFRAFLKQGEAGFAENQTPGSGPDAVLAKRLRNAERAAVARDWNRADRFYGEALALAPADWPRRADVLVSRIAAIFRLRAWNRCVAFGAANLAKTGTSASAGDFIYYASVCADRSEDKAAATAMRSKAAKRLATVVGDKAAALSVDDRSDGLRILRTLHISLGDESAAKRVAKRQRAVLDAAAKAAPSAFAAMTYNWPRAEVYVYLNVPGELVADLEASVKALPRQYDPPYRLAWIYSKLSRPDDALAMAKRALDLAYGPRKAGIQSFVARLYAARGDAAAHVAALAAVVKIYEALPDGQKKPGALERAKQALAKAK